MYSLGDLLASRDDAMNAPESFYLVRFRIYSGRKNE